MSAKGPGCVKTQTLNLRVEFPSHFVVAETNRTGSCCWQWAMETILGVLRSDAFSHSVRP